MPHGETEFLVVGVMAHERTSGASTVAGPRTLASYWQLPWAGGNLVVHLPPGTRLDDSALRRIVASVDPDVPVGGVTTLGAIAARAVATPRYQMAVVSSFGVLALLLALIGCYSVVSYSVGRRTREFGVRMALGASQARVLGSVLRWAALLVGAGLATGTALALATTRLLESILYGVEATDGASFAFAAAMLFTVSVLAACVPARRAAAIEPVVALREE